MALCRAFASSVWVYGGVKHATWNSARTGMCRPAQAGDGAHLPHKQEALVDVQRRDVLRADDDARGRMHDGAGHLVHPRRQRRAEERGAQPRALSAGGVDRVHLLDEALAGLEHLVCLVEDEQLHMRQVDLHAQAPHAWHSLWRGSVQAPLCRPHTVPSRRGTASGTVCRPRCAGPPLCRPQCAPFGSDPPQCSARELLRVKHSHGDAGTVLGVAAERRALRWEGRCHYKLRCSGRAVAVHSCVGESLGLLDRLAGLYVAIGRHGVPSVV